MKIVHISIKNLASLGGKTEISFTQEPLASAGIFAITGNTGAGKSTILDALCLALYGKTPRYKNAENGIDVLDVNGSTIKQDDVRGILRDGTAEGYASVSFIGVDNKGYTATWSVRRARNKADGNLQSYEMGLKVMDTNEDIPGKKRELLEEIERLVGLNFEQFTRSVLLAQGDFTAFLKAGKDEKASLLEKLTGSYVYSQISKKVYEKHKEQQQNLRDLNTRLEGIAICSEEEVAALQAQKIEAEKAKVISEKEATQLSKEITWYQEIEQKEKAVATAYTSYEQAQQALEAAKEREAQWQKVNRVQGIKPQVRNWEALQTEIAAKKQSIAETEQQYTALQTKKEAVEAAFKAAQQRVTETEAEEVQTEPLRTEAKRLEVQLKEKENQLQQAKEAYATAVHKEEELTKQQQELEASAKHIQQTIEATEQWFTENESRKPIAANEQLIVSKLKDATAFLNKLQPLQLALEKQQQSVTAQQEEVQQLSAKQKEREVRVKEWQQQWEAHKTELENIPVAAIETAHTKVQQQIEQLREAITEWKFGAQALAEQKRLVTAQEECQQALETNQQALQQQTQQLSEKKIAKETTAALVAKARIQAAGNVKQLRSSLQPEEPCPVCGSTHHPYASTHPQVDQLLADLEQEAQQTETAYTAIVAAHSKTSKEAETLAERKLTLQKQLAENTKNCEVFQQRWEQFSVAAEVAAFPETERADKLQAWLDENRKQEQELQQQLQKANQLREQTAKLREELAEEEKQSADLEKQLKDAERNLEYLQKEIVEKEKQQTDLQQQLDSLTAEVATYVTAAHWFEQWQKDPQGFEQSVQKFAKQWKTKETELEEQRRQSEVLVANQNGLLANKAASSQEVTQKKAIRDQLQTELSGMQTTYQGLFKGVSVQEVEKQLKAAIQQAKETLETTRKQWQQLEKEDTALQAKLKEQQTDTANATTKAQQLSTELEQWLASYAAQYKEVLSQEELQGLLSFDLEWIETERAALQALKDAVLQTKVSWEEHQKTLVQHKAQQLSERSLEALTALKKAVDEQLAAHTKTIHEIEFKLKEDAVHKQEMGSLVKEIQEQQTITDNWAKLNDIIGSADGKKFRQSAQEYTLEVLLSFANVHLKVLSKRYVLQRIPNSLGLQVIDQMMGDEVRTVYSLSGGESFLVSLALALGLASLSSNRMKVESLFIDEGFGSLDPDTLNVAMDALERLHNQGRKVGVISHVQEMTERIPVQIQVSKQQSGKSAVTVIGV